MFVEQNVKNKTAVALITSAVVTAPAAASAVVDQAVKEIAFSLLLLLLLPSSENLRNFRHMTSKVLRNRILIRHQTIPVQNRRQQLFKVEAIDRLINHFKY